MSFAANESFVQVDSSQWNRFLLSIQRPEFSSFDLNSILPKKKITAKTLCDITGTKYYLHNEELDFSNTKILRVYDENDKLIGDLPFEEALNSAKIAKKDLVLR